MEAFGRGLFLTVGVGLLIGSYFVIDGSVFTGVMMRWLGFAALVFALLFVGD